MIKRTAVCINQQYSPLPSAAARPGGSVFGIRRDERRVEGLLVEIIQQHGQAAAQARFQQGDNP
jgi:hypothetical protein